MAVKGSGLRQGDIKLAIRQCHVPQALTCLCTCRAAISRAELQTGTPFYLSHAIAACNSLLPTLLQPLIIIQLLRVVLGLVSQLEAGRTP